MGEGPPFERYPGALRQDRAGYRVISPWRDAVAWVSIAGPLAISRYLVRANSNSGWREITTTNDGVREPDDAIWELAWRDPVEAEFRAHYAGGEACARVTVTSRSCEIQIGIAHMAPETALDIVSVSPKAALTWTGSDTLLIELGPG